MKRLSMYRLPIPLWLLVLSGCVAETPLSVGITPGPSLRCDKAVLLAIQNRLRNKLRDLLQTWQRDIGI